MARIMGWILMLLAGFIASQLIFKLLLRDRRRRYPSDRREWWAG